MRPSETTEQQTNTFHSLNDFLWEFDTVVWLLVVKPVLKRAPNHSGCRQTQKPLKTASWGQVIFNQLRKLRDEHPSTFARCAPGGCTSLLSRYLWQYRHPNYVTDDA